MPDATRNRLSLRGCLSAVADALFAKRNARLQMEHEIEQNCEQLCQAITAKDMDAITAGMNETRFNREQVEAVVAEAVKTDDITLFNAVIEKMVNNDVNLELAFPRGEWTEQRYSLLGWAINVGSKNIAEALAEDPRVNAEKGTCLYDWHNRIVISESKPLEMGQAVSALPSIQRALVHRRASIGLGGHA